MLLDRVSVRLRLCLAHAVWTSILYCFIAVGLYKVLELSLRDSVDAALLSSAQSVRDARFSFGGSDYSGEFLINRFLRDPWQIDELTGERLIRPYAQVIDVSGQVRSRAMNTPANLPVTPYAVERAEQGLAALETFQVKGRPPLRQVTLPVIQDGAFTGELIQVAASLGQTRDTLRGTISILWFMFPFVVLVSVVLGYWITGRSFRPVREITRAAGAMGIDDLSTRLPTLPADDELSELSQTFNALFDRLEESVQRLRRFTGDVSHELRTPLAVLRGEAELALRRERDGEEYRSALKTVVRESEHMTAIVEDLLLLARAESRSVAMNWQTPALRDFVKDLIASVEPVYAGLEVKLVAEIAPKDEEEPFPCVPGYLSLALKNILLNAAKHSVKGESVFLSVIREGENTRFGIVDRGEGIAEEDVPRIFDPFFRADSARNRAAGGAGIGLSLAMALVKLHHGRIDVASAVGSGTRFIVEIPPRRPGGERATTLV